MAEFSNMRYSLFLSWHISLYWITESVSLLLLAFLQSVHHAAINAFQIITPFASKSCFLLHSFRWLPATTEFSDFFQVCISNCVRVFQRERTKQVCITMYLYLYLPTYKDIYGSCLTWLVKCYDIWAGKSGSDVILFVIYLFPSYNLRQPYFIKKISTFIHFLHTTWTRYILGPLFSP